MTSCENLRFTFLGRGEQKGGLRDSTATVWLEGAVEGSVEGAVEGTVEGSVEGSVEDRPPDWDSFSTTQRRNWKRHHG